MTGLDALTIYSSISINIVLAPVPYYLGIYPIITFDITPLNFSYSAKIVAPIRTWLTSSKAHLARGPISYLLIPWRSIWTILPLCVIISANRAIC